MTEIMLRLQRYLQVHQYNSSGKVQKGLDVQNTWFYLLGQIIA